MLAKLKSHQHPHYFLLYAASYMAYGLCLTILGPMIPYLSKETGLIETEYSYLFSCRSFGMLAGGLLVKVFQARKVSNHSIVIFGSVVIGVNSCLFSMTISTLSTFWLGVYLFLTSMGYAFIEIAVNICIMMTNNSKNI